MTSQQQADELLRERQGHGIVPECRLDAKGEKINQGAAMIKCEPGFALFIYLVSLREELRVRAKPLPRYVERNCNGKLSFRVDHGARIPLPNDPTTPEFHRAYSEALVDAIANEPDHDDWSELEALHRAQRRGTAKHGGKR
jgi:hypothetical protein